MDLQELERVGIDWIDLDQDREIWRALMAGIRNLRVSYNAGNFLPS
jgi:hypothetical protein